ncbi:MAG: LysR family transcriptional regulator [Clostridia bacterium]|nr:LysR family transcriptional regulator [Clostridia bacterium]
METDYIPEFIALAEYGSSYLAAEKLFVSPSSLLRHVQTIEDEFGVPLFDRTRKGFILNKNGQIFLPYAKQISSLKSHCHRALHQEMENKQTVRLCAEGKIIELMIDFRKVHPDVCIEYYKTANPEEALFDGQIDVAFLTNLTPRRADLYQTIPYSSEEALVLVYEGHPLAEMEKVTLERLKEEDFITLSDDFTIDDLFYSRIDNGAGPNIVASVPIGNDLIRMVREKLGITLIHGQRGMVPLAEGLKVLEVDPPIRYEMSICFRKDPPLSPAAEQFVRFARRWTETHPDVNRSLIEE